jgi:hypothetical protein
MTRENRSVDECFDALRRETWTGPTPCARTTLVRRRGGLHPRSSVIAAIALCATAWGAAAAIASGAGEKVAERMWLSLNLESLDYGHWSSITVTGDVRLRMIVNGDTEAEDSMTIEVLLDRTSGAVDGDVTVTGVDGVIAPLIFGLADDGTLEVAIARAPSADVTGDGAVDATDLAMVLAQYGESCDCPADANVDGVVDAEDIRYVALRYGETAEDGK